MEAIKQPDGTWDIIGIESWAETYSRMCTMLSEGINFKFARYGDGEIFCMNGKVGRNCDKHEYFPYLGMDLNIAIGRAEYMVGIQPLSVSQGLHKTIQLPTGKIYNADVLHNASICGGLRMILSEMVAPVIVGPAHLKAYGIEHILIPSLNCWEVHAKTCEQIQKKINEGRKTFILCASMTSEVIIDRFRHDDITMIDFGSVLDPYAGVKSRRYHETLNTSV